MEWLIYIGERWDPSIVGTPLSLQRWGAIFQNIPIMRHYIALPRNLGRRRFKKMEKILSAYDLLANMW